MGQSAFWTWLGVLAFGALMTLCTVFCQRPAPKVVGNLCAVTKSNPSGHRTRDLPAGSFPLAYLFDRGGVVVTGSATAERPHLRSALCLVNS